MTAIILYDCADKETMLKKVLLTVFEESESNGVLHFTFHANKKLEEHSSTDKMDHSVSKCGRE